MFCNNPVVDCWQTLLWENRERTLYFRNAITCRVFSFPNLENKTWHFVDTGWYKRNVDKNERKNRRIWKLDCWSVSILALQSRSAVTSLTHFLCLEVALQFYKPFKAITFKFFLFKFLYHICYLTNTNMIHMRFTQCDIQNLNSKKTSYHIDTFYGQALSLGDKTISISENNLHW